jgi:hypothetical protein
MGTLNERFESIDTDPNLSDQGKTRARAELAASALSELAEYKPTKKAAAAVQRRLENLREKLTVLPGAPTSHADIALATEIRGLIRSQAEPEQWVFKHRADAKIINAVLAAPAVLSGLEPEAVERIRALATEVNHPQEVAQMRDLEQAQKVTEQALEHARERTPKARPSEAGARR